ncbi:uncharacterized protein DDB_G0283697-like isoform X2 [Portunus trituberculatus]|uniref:uncharacterized protein DDB_G0283697-like isoform X2 n=1 Tax=Portunus trituberculatus TaxID=210409 RepID=UPI001E1D1A03|nr:uncharacterized protein DDB_G0283697-like isoform X2 [Portunus trituberculatus]
MKPPPLLLLLLVAGFVSCIPQERLDRGDGKDSVVPQFGVGSSGGSSRNLSEDSDQESVDELPRDVRADDDTQARKDLWESKLIQTQEENISSPKALSRSLRIFRYREVPSRSKKRSRARYGYRGRSKQKPVSYGADHNNIQEDEEDYNSGEQEGVEENDEVEDGNDGDYDDEDDDKAQEMDEKEEEEQEEEEEDLRRPPKSRKKKPRKGWMRRRRTRYREGHEDTKRGYREYNNLGSDDETSPPLESQMKSREKRQVGSNARGREGNEYSDSGSSDSDDADETTPLLWGSRKTGDRNGRKIYRDDSRYSSRRKTTDRGILSKIKQILYPFIKYKKLKNRDSENEKRGYYGDNEGKEIMKRGLGSKFRALMKGMKQRIGSRQKLIDDNNKSLNMKNSEVLAESKADDREYKGGQDQKINHKNIFSIIKARFGKKDKPRTNSYQRFSNSEDYGNFGYAGDDESQDIVKRGFIAKIRNLFNKMRKTKPSAYERVRESQRSDDGWRNDGYDEGDTYNDEQMDYEDYGDETTLLLPEERRGSRTSATRFRNKRSDINLLERVLRNVALISSHLKEEVTPNTSPSPLLGNPKESLQKEKIERDVLGGNEDEDENDKVSKYDEGDSEDEGIGDDDEEEEEKEEQEEEEEKEEEEDEEKGKDYDDSEGKGKNREYDEDYESEAQDEENEKQGDEYDDQESEDDLADEYETENEENEGETDGNENGGEGKIDEYEEEN